MIKITTDSTCDLPRSLLEQHDITVIPLGIVKAGRLYQDGVDIRIEDIAAHVDARRRHHHHQRRQYRRL